MSWTLETAKHQLLQVCDYRTGADGEEEHTLESNAAFQWLCAHVWSHTVKIVVKDLDEVQAEFQRVISLNGQLASKARARQDREAEALRQNTELRKEIQHLKAARDGAVNQAKRWAARAATILDTWIGGEDEAVEEMRLIKALTEHGVTRLTIHHPNPDSDGPERAIDYASFNFVNGEMRKYRYGAPTLLECLQQAAKEHLSDA